MHLMIRSKVSQTIPSLLVYCFFQPADSRKLQLYLSVGSGFVSRF